MTSSQAIRRLEPRLRDSAILMHGPKILACGPESTAACPPLAPWLQQWKLAETAARPTNR